MSTSARYSDAGVSSTQSPQRNAVSGCGETGGWLRPSRFHAGRSVMVMKPLDSLDFTLLESKYVLIVYVKVFSRVAVMPPVPSFHTVTHKRPHLLMDAISRGTQRDSTSLASQDVLLRLAHAANASAENGVYTVAFQPSKRPDLRIEDRHL
jgi:hypothetical protein